MKRIWTLIDFIARIGTLILIFAYLFFPAEWFADYDGNRVVLIAILSLMIQVQCLRADVIK